MASADMSSCNNCSYIGEDLWIISGECEHRNCTKCIVKNVLKCETCRKVKTIECLYASSGCSTLFKRERLELLKSHLKVCHYRKVSCPNDCSEWLNRKDLVYHVSDLCPKRLLHCSHCENDFFAEEMERHLASCDYVPVKCQFCEEQTLRMDMNAHLKDCSLAVWPCEFSIFGCDFQGASNDLEKHLTLSSHAKFFIARERKSEEKINKLSQEVSLLKQDRKTSEARLQEYEVKQKQLEEENMSLREEVLSVRRNTESLKEEVKSLNEKLKDSIMDKESSVDEKDEALKTELTGAVEEVKSFTEHLQQRLQVLEQDKEIEQKELLSFSDSFRAELLPGLISDVELREVDVMLFCLQLIKEWATGVKHLQEFNTGKEHIDFFNYYSLGGRHYKINRLSRIGCDAVYNLGLSEFAWISRTYVLDRNYKVTTKKIQSPYTSVQLVVRFRFLTSKDKTDVFVEVSHATVSNVCVQLYKDGVPEKILDTSLTDLQTLVNKVPIFCGRVNSADLFCDSYCYFLLNAW